MRDTASGDRAAPTAEDTNRIRVGQLSLEQRHADLARDAGERVTMAVPGYAFSYAAAMIERDDEHGRSLGWVTRGDLIRWADLATIAKGAAEKLDDEHDGRHTGGCPTVVA